MTLATLVLFSAAAATAQQYRDRSVPISAVEMFDLDRYLGKWFEIARFPNRFEKGCEGVTADYAMRDDGKVSVINTCREGDRDGPAKSIEGQATVKGVGKLSVTFVPWLPFARGDYWVLWVDDDYRVAAIGNRRGKTGWILARTPRISNAQRAAAEAALTRNGYDVKQLYDVAQPPL